jgi:hypothetical protein
MFFITKNRATFKQIASSIAMIEVFKTSVREQEQAEMILSTLVNSFPSIKINFDLQDCDHVLRVEGREFSVIEIVNLLQANGHHCEPLD